MVITPSKPLERKNKILFWQTRSIIRLFSVKINDYSFYNSYIFSYLFIHYKEFRFKEESIIESKILYLKFCFLLRNIFISLH